jgi:hypothetical protein
VSFAIQRAGADAPRAPPVDTASRKADAS